MPAAADVQFRTPFCNPGQSRPLGHGSGPSKPLILLTFPRAYLWLHACHNLCDGYRTP